MYNNISKKITLTAGALATIGCTSVDNKGFVIPHTDINVIELLFSEEFDQHYYDPGKDGYKICRQSSVHPDVKVSQVDVVMYSKTMGSLGNENDCQVMQLKKLPSNSIYNKKLIKNNCTYYFSYKKGKISKIYYIFDGSIDYYAKCRFRLALFSKGMNGALDISDERLFVRREKSPWAHLSPGPSYVPLVHWFMGLCDFKMRQFDSVADAVRASESVRCGKLK